MSVSLVFVAAVILPIFLPEKSLFYCMKNILFLLSLTAITFTAQARKSSGTPRLGH